MPISGLLDQHKALRVSKGFKCDNLLERISYGLSWCDNVEFVVDADYEENKDVFQAVFIAITTMNLMAERKIKSSFKLSFD